VKDNANRAACKPCLNANSREAYAKSENQKSNKANYYKEHKDKISVARAIHYRDNAEHYKKVNKTSNKAWRKANPDKAKSIYIRRSVRVKQATPSWLTNTMIVEIKLVYAKVKDMNIESDIMYNVDHIIPIYNKKVCGLHVPWNLQIITSMENQSKGFSINEG